MIDVIALAALLAAYFPCATPTHPLPEAQRAAILVAHDSTRVRWDADRRGWWVLTPDGRIFRCWCRR